MKCRIYECVIFPCNGILSTTSNGVNVCIELVFKTTNVFFGGLEINLQYIIRKNIHIIFFTKLFIYQQHRVFNYAKKQIYSHRKISTANKRHEDR